MEFKNNQIIENKNLSQLRPNTEIAKGVTGLTFKSCNLTNCKVPKDAKIIDCNTTQVSYCTHLYPEFIKKGLEECPEDCEHRISDKKELVEVSKEEFEKAINSKEISKESVVIEDVKDEKGIIEKQIFKITKYKYQNRIL